MPQSQNVRAEEFHNTAEHAHDKAAVSKTEGGMRDHEQTRLAEEQAREEANKHSKGAVHEQALSHGKAASAAAKK